MRQLKPLTLRRNFSWTFMGNGVYSACQWGMLVVMAKLGSPEMVGQFTLALSVTAPVIMFTNLQLSTVQSTDTQHEFTFKDYLGLRLVMSCLGVLMVVGITIAAGYSLQTTLIIIAMVLAKAVEATSDVFYGLLQKHERMDRISVSMIMRGVLALLLLGMGIYLTQNVLWGVIGLACAWGFVLIGYDSRSGKVMQQSGSDLKTPLRWNSANQQKLVRLSLPLGIVMMLISLNNNIPRYFIEHYWSERELGIFAAMAYLMVATSMFVGALGQSVGPRLAKYYAFGDKVAFTTLFIKLIVIVMLLSGVGMLVVLFMGRDILTLLYSSEYAKHADLLVWLMLANSIGLIGSLLGSGMSAVRYFHAQLPVYSVVTLISVIASFYLIPSMGMKGAVMTLIISALVQVILSFGVLHHALSKKQQSIIITGKV